MTESEAMKKMETAINTVVGDMKATPSFRAASDRANEIRVAPQGLDAGRLLELARERLVYARTRLTEVRREHQMKLFEIDAVCQQRIEEAHREREAAIAALEQQTASAAKPAADMIALVERMLA